MSETSTERQLRAFSEILRRLHRLQGKRYEGFEELTNDFIREGCDIFGLETGIVFFATAVNRHLRDHRGRLEPEGGPGHSGCSSDFE